MEKDEILDSQEIDRKIRRMAYEIYEANFKEKKLILAGINGQGYALAQILKNELDAISKITTVLLEIKVDKDHPELSEVNLEGETKGIADKSVIVVDDVLNTGRTLIYSLRPFLDMKVKKLEVALMVDRNYNTFPVKANFVGIELSTTLNDHVVVSLEKEKSVYFQ